HYLFQAKRFAGKTSKLVVVIARDSNVKKTKGFKPINDEIHRRELVGALRIVDKAVLGRKTNIFQTVLDFAPELIVLGYDQRVDLSKLKKFFADNNFSCKIKRASALKPRVYKSSKIKQKLSKQG
ncbi:MAG: FAD synthase, partial [Candidatus Diapherotrites archaeon]|nr:FAD synthase [Candidatus Diapherotrites archaeon]